MKVLTNNMPVQISVALATYNGEKYIREQLNSIFNQSFQDFELIVCDDNSCDNTVSIIQEYIAKYPQIIFKKNEVNLGFRKNFEQAISLCNGKYIAFCDQDDVWTKDHLEILINNIGPYDCIGANADFVDSRGAPLHVTMTKYLLIQDVPKTSEELFSHELYGNMIQGTACLFSKELADKVFPIPENIKFHDYWIALNAGISNGCTYVDQVILQYRRHANNATDYERFSFFKSVKKINRLSKDKKAFYNEWIPYLEALMRKDMVAEKKAEIVKAYNFYRNLSEDKSRIANLLYYIRNYKKITLTRYSHILAFGFRFLSLLVFGIKY